MHFSDGLLMRLYRQTIEDFGLYPGLELDTVEMEKLKNSAQEMSAKMRAIRIVAASSVSKQELEHRLVQKGEGPEHAKQAVQWMQDMQLVDDRQTAQQIVVRCISKGYGVTRAKQVLFEKRIPKEYWQEALEDYPDQLDAILDFLRNRLHNMDDTKQVRRAVDALMRKGHSYSRIKQALDMLSLDTGEFPEDE